MEIAIGIFIGIIFALVTGRGRKRRELTPPSDVNNTETKRKRLRQADEELITVILPTIKNDK